MFRMITHKRTLKLKLVEFIFFLSFKVDIKDSGIQFLKSSLTKMQRKFDIIRVKERDEEKNP